MPNCLESNSISHNTGAHELSLSYIYQTLTKNIFNGDISRCHPWAKESKTFFHFYDLSIIWSVDIWYKPKLQTYCLIRNRYSTKPYVTFDLNKGQRSLCIMVKNTTVSSGDRQVFNGTPEEDRLCLLCDLGDTENEIHFLFCCPVCDDLRDELFTKMLSIYVDFFCSDE